MRRRKILLLFAIAFFLVAAACGCHILREQNAKQQEQHEFETLEDEYTLPEPTFVPAPESDDDKTQTISTHDGDALTGTNSDYFGWLTIPDTIISYPVMYSPGNPERYLHADFYGNYSFSGTPFLDARCDPNDGNLIIYGHNMTNGTMFGSLKRFRDRAYLAAHPYVYLEQADGVHVFETIAAVTIPKNDPWYCFLKAANVEEEKQWVSDLREKSGLHVGTIPENSVPLLTLSTCNGTNRSERMIIVAKEVITP